MAETFKVGEIAICVAIGSNDVRWPEYDGQEVEIVGALENRNVWGDRARTWRQTACCYRIRTSDGYVLCALPENLRKKRLPPPREETGEWDQCPWQPERSTVGKSGG
jgi:hypothetical protein